MRALVRDPAKLEAVLKPFALDGADIEAVQGDVTHAATSWPNGLPLPTSWNCHVSLPPLKMAPFAAFSRFSLMRFLVTDGM